MMIPRFRLIKAIGLSFVLTCACVSSTSVFAKEKLLKLVLTSPEGPLDPALASDVNSLSVNENIFEPMLRYDYLARPVALKPNTLEHMPTISTDGKTYTFKLKPGIFFSPDPAFKNAKRELIAEDYRYSLQRIYDKKNKSPWLFMFQGKIVDDEKLNSVESPALERISGIEVIDKYTLRIKLKQADQNMLYILATPASAAVAREVVEKYGTEIGNHPIGTGPFMMGAWQRSFKINLLANPLYRKPIFEDRASSPENKSIEASMSGQRFPKLDRIEIKIIEEPQSRLLGFLNKEFDFLEQVPAALSHKIMRDKSLLPEIEKQGVKLSLFSTSQTYYVWMNMQDPVIGGYTPEKIALRRAIVLSYSVQEDIQLQSKGLAIAAQSPLPPNVTGFDSKFKSPTQHNLVLANALLDKFAYRRGKDQYRTNPDGSPLTLTMYSKANADGLQRNEIWRRHFESIGIRVEFKNEKHAEIIKAARLGKIQMAEADWIADFPDAENFYQLFYSGNIGRANYSRFSLPQFDKLFEQMQAMPHSPKRQEVINQMAYLIHAYNPWVLRIHPLSADVYWSSLQNYVRHPVDFTNWRYLDVANQ